MTQPGTRTAPAADAPARTGLGLRPNALALVVMLLIQYVLGMWVNLFAALPKPDQGKGILAGFGAAVANGPAGLTLHALLGIALLLGAIVLVARAVLARQVPAAVLAAVALIAIVSAWMSGARFVGHTADGTSFAMAAATAVALLCYTVVLFRRAPAGS